MRSYVAFALLLMLAFSFAWTLTPPTCPTSKTINGVNFIVTYPNTVYSCSASNLFVYGNFTRTVTDGYVNGVNSTHMALSSGVFGTSTYSEAYLPSSGNYSIYATTTGTFAADTAQISCGGVLAGDDGGTPAAPAGWSLVDYNSTHYQVVGVANYDTTLSPFNCSKSSTISYSASGAAGNTVIIYMPAYIMSQYKETNFSTTTISGNSSYAYISHNTFNPSSLRSDFKTNVGKTISTSGITGNYFRAILYYSGNQIIPLITYFPSVDAYPLLFNASDNTAFLRNNTVAYVLDNYTGNWFIVPAFSVSNFVDTYSLSTLYAPSSGSGITTPLIPNTLSCYVVGDQYKVNSTWATTVNHVLYYYNTTTLNITSATANSFYQSVNITTYPFVNYTINGVQYCVNTNQTGILNLPSLSLPITSTKTLMAIIWIGSLGVSIAAPFALIFVLAFNDIFQFVTVTQMAMVLVFTAIMSAFANTKLEFTMKSLSSHLAFGLLLLVFYYSLVGAAASDFQTMFQSLQSTAGSGNVFQFAAGTITFLPTLFYFMITNLIGFVMPSGLVSTALMNLSPPVATAFNYISLALVAAIMSWLTIRAYDAIRNTFRPT